MPTKFAATGAVSNCDFTVTDISRVIDILGSNPRSNTNYTQISPNYLQFINTGIPGNPGVQTLQSGVTFDWAALLSSSNLLFGGAATGTVVALATASGLSVEAQKEVWGWKVSKRGRPNDVPIPAALSLLIAGLGGLGYMGRKKHKHT